MIKCIAKLVVTIFCISLLGCNSDSDQSDIIKEQRNELWYSDIYGEIKQISGDSVVTWQVTGAFCYPIITLDPLPLFDSFSQKYKDQLIYERPYDSGPASYRSIQNIEDVCTDGILDTIAGNSYEFDAEVIFQLFWLDMQNHYAFFKERNIDWEHIYEVFAPKLHGNDEEQLINIISEILEILSDGHTRLYYNLDEEPISFEAKLTLAKRLEQEAHDLELKGEAAENYIIEQTVLVRENITQYLNKATQPAFIARNTLNSFSPNWGIIDVEGIQVGYLSLPHFVNFIETDNLERQDISYANEAFNNLLDEVFIALDGTQKLIIDIRDNEGGYDIQALELIKRFISGNTLVWDISTFYAGSLHELVTVYAEPDSRPYYQNDIYLLTSNGTFSAGESFALAMSTLPKVTLVGEPTAGATSDTFPRMLPNGWAYELSNEYYKNGEGLNAEVLGVPVDIEVDPYDKFARGEKKDLTIEKIITLLTED
ncbi:S41 family peptidase [Pseudoalteromonas sp. SG44-1]|uniref:S41 family peptidase n=1 Tax=Pseudoalteromonas sp. SG44-1 TaxID=2760964 RepID=UPI001600AC2B|nr:S41 family peptidase [Pseudoalteromonas sp. SG44-1]MBB1416252.1 S41 family peptidase [Pseudoalteromonas sp. SG44-1]